MDIQHISALIETLATLGFSSSVGRALLFNACLQQKNFTVREQMCFGEDTVNYQLYFKEDASKNLICSYYDATLRKAIEIAASVISGVDVLDLEKRMSGVNWQMPKEDSSADNLQIADKSTWKQEAEMEAITMELERLASTEEGAGLANRLKYKFWAELSLQNMISEPSALKSRYELSQRFYVINGDGITAGEAYRFLNNRWMERIIHASNKAIRMNAPEPHMEKTTDRHGNNRKKNKNLSKVSSCK